MRLQAEVAQLRAECEDRGIEARRSKEQLEVVERMTTCQVCMQHKVDTLLGGCGHLLCHRCAQQIRDRCPFCRAELTGESSRLRL